MWVKLLAALLVAVTGTGVGLYYAYDDVTPTGTAAAKSPCCEKSQSLAAKASCCEMMSEATETAAPREALAACTGGLCVVAGGPTTKAAAVKCCEE